MIAGPIAFVLNGMLVCAAIMSLAGCGGPYDATAYGVVSLDGQVVPRGTVAYHPVGGGPAAYARIEDDGSYLVRTGREEGLPSGEYEVTVTANEPAAMQQTAHGGPPPPGKAITPPWYRTRNTSGLKVAVQPGNNELNLDLKSQPPPTWTQGAQR
jgi:hypothetical protein